MKNYTVKNPGLLFPELSFRINGILFDVFKEIGGGHKEKIYQAAVKIGLQRENISFKEQYYAPLTFENKTVGKYYLDFLIEDTVVLELKRGRYIPINIINQAKQYLSALNLKLAIIGCFSFDCVVLKRIINEN
jgi:GxxExxY protein